MKSVGAAGSWRCSRLTPAHRVGRRHVCCNGWNRGYMQPVSAARRRGMSSGRLRPMKIRNIMSEAVPTCGPRDLLLDAARVMLRHNVSCLPVVTADESRRVVGMLTDRDVSMAVARDHGALGELQVRSAMGPGEPSCSPDAPVADALERMHSAGVSRLPVVDDRGRLAGLLSLEDVARAVSSGRGDVPYELICWTIAESAHPRSSAERRETGVGDPARPRSEPQRTPPRRGG